MEEEILNIILKRNSWWQTGKVSEENLKEFHRDAFYKILERIENRRIISILGLRRVGKTVILYQLINELLKRTKPQNILFISFDEIMAEEAKIFDEIIEWYTTKILEGRKEKVYVFVDEIHFLPDWERKIKHYFETDKNMKFIISGSASIKLKKGQIETLAGRLDEIELMPFSFKEILSLNKIKTKKFQGSITNFGEVEKFYITLEERTKIKALFEKYLVFGGLPEAWIENYSISLWQEYLIKDVVKKIVLQDLVATFKIRRPLRLLKLLKYFAYNITGYYEATNAGRDIGMDRDLVEYYLNYLLQTFLVFLLQRYGKEELKAREKMYLGDVGIRNALLGIDKSDARNVENILFLNINPSCYWKNKHEVDFIIGDLAIESKYSDKLGKDELEGIAEFLKKHKHKTIILTKDILKKERIDNKEILLIPTWLFLLCF